MQAYMGIDVGSVSTDIVLIDDNNNLIADVYIRTSGQPIQAVQRGLRMIIEAIPPDLEVCAVGTTGSGRELAAAIVGADVVKNEITAHAVAGSAFLPGVQTILEIGGQDSKIIILRNGIVADFAMNSVCAAGTGSFLDQQAARLGIPIEDFGPRALKSQTSVRIAGRCSVFAESDMIHKQQMGHKMEDLLAGLCEALARNYLNNVGKGKEILPPVLFQGGVAANQGMKKAMEKELGMEVFIPEHYGLMGAIGVAMLARNAVKSSGGKTNFRGFEITDENYDVTSFECSHCPNLCEIISISVGDDAVCRWGGRCEKWQVS
jgi:predicted CoA-substrate-specific enzyme activase